MVNSRDVLSIVLGRFRGNGSLQLSQTQWNESKVAFRVIRGGSSVVSVMMLNYVFSYKFSSGISGHSDIDMIVSYLSNLGLFLKTG